MSGGHHGLAITLGDMNTFLKASGRRLMPTANMRKPRPGAYMPGVNLHKHAPPVSWVPLHETGACFNCNSAS